MSIQAASILYGPYSCEVKSVTNAWYAVGVGSTYISPLISSITYGEDCNSIQINASTSPTTSLTWTTTQGLLINGNSSPQTITGNSVTITSTNGNYAYVTAFLDACASSTVDFCPCVAWPGNPYITWVWSSPAPGEPLEAHVTSHPEAQRYIWMVGSQVIQDGPDTTLMAYDYPCVWDKDVYVIAVLDCGANAPVYGGPYSPLCGSHRSAANVVAYPNPASSQLTVRLNVPAIAKVKENTSPAGLSQILSVTVYDKTGRQRKTVKLAGGARQVNLNVVDLPGDVYYLEVSDGIRVKRIPVLIKK